MLRGAAEELVLMMSLYIGEVPEVVCVYIEKVLIG